MNQTRLAAFLRGELERRGWDQKDLAIAAEMRESHLSDILTGKIKAPRPPALMRLAAALNLEPGVLLEVAGYGVTLPQTPEDQQRRLAYILGVAPWLQSLFDKVPDLPEDKQRQIVTFAEYVYQDWLASQSQTRK